jgi:hypothetical protein
MVRIALKYSVVKIKSTSCLAVIKDLLMIVYIMLRICILLQMYVMVN